MDTKRDSSAHVGERDDARSLQDDSAVRRPCRLQIRTRGYRIKITERAEVTASQA